MNFVVSLRLPEPPSIDPIRRRLERYPSLRLKLDPTSDWDRVLVDALAATGAVDSVDLKGQYEGTVVDQGADPELYRLVAESFPDAWIEDPRLTPETDEVLRPTATASRGTRSSTGRRHRGAALPDAHGQRQAVRARAAARAARRLLLLRERGIGMYGGGQFELGPAAARSSSGLDLPPRHAERRRAGGFNDTTPRQACRRAAAARGEPEGFRWGEWSQR